MSRFYRKGLEQHPTTAKIEVLIYLFAESAWLVHPWPLRTSHFDTASFHYFRNSLAFLRFLPSPFFRARTKFHHTGGPSRSQLGSSSAQFRPAALAQQRSAVQCRALPCGTVRCCAVLCRAVTCCAMVCHGVPCQVLHLLFRACIAVVSCHVPAELSLVHQLSSAQLSSAAHRSASSAERSVVRCRAVPCGAVPCRAVQYCAVLCRVLPCCMLCCTYSFVHAIIIRSIIPRTGTINTTPGWYVIHSY